MKIAIDYRSAVSEGAGIGQMTKEITKALFERQDENQYAVFLDKDVDLPDGWSKRLVTKVPGPASGLRWMYQVSQTLKKENFDALISPSAMNFPLLFPRTLQIVNDLAPIEFPEGFSPKQRAVYKLGLKVTADAAKWIFFISNTVQTEFRSRYKTKAKFDFSLLGLNSFITQPPSMESVEQAAKDLRLPENFICSVSTLEPRKNYPNMIRAFKNFSENHPDFYYLIGGRKGWMYDLIFRVVEEEGLIDKVKFLDFIDETQKYALYRNAKAFLYMSFYEGFGLPNIEAAALGLPVVTSDIPVLREVMGENALYANPKNPHDISHKLEQAARESRVDHSSFLTKFTWRNVANKIVNLLEQPVAQQ